MKNQQKLYKRPKRTTFLKLFAKGALCGLLATGVFAGLLYAVKSKDIYEDVQQELSAQEAQFFSKFSDYDNENVNQVNRNLDAFMSVYTGYDVLLDDSYLLPDPDMVNFATWMFIPGISDNCYAISAVVNENQEIVYSSKETLTMMIIFGEGSQDSGWYTCDAKEIPELYQAYQEMENKITDVYADYVSLKISSAYVDTENLKFIPHDVELIFNRDSEQTDDIQKMTIDSDNPDYELITLNIAGGDGGEQYPKVFMANFHGTKESIFNEIYSRVAGQIKYAVGKGTYTSGMYGVSSTANVYYETAPVWINGQKNTLVMAFQVDVWNKYVKIVYFTLIGIFFLMTLLIDLFYSLHKNKVNQMTYQFEDYQRTLINNLAHDLKTPLMAINGYAENLLTAYKMEDQPKKYLQSILENVKYTDSVINQTLELNKIQEMQTLQKSVCNLKEITGKALRKYDLLLDEHQITVHSEGDAEIMANPETLTSAIENLISNAVKYTPLGGEINIKIGDKSLRMDNTVTGKTETSALLLPFTKGDKSRTGKSGSGLGLTIAENALRANGFKLEISCTDNEFITEIQF